MSTESVLAQIDDAIDDWKVGPDAMRCNAPSEARPGPPSTGRTVPVVIRIDARAFARAMDALADQLAQLLNSADLAALVAMGERIQRKGAAAQLDRAAYHRRRRARLRRRR